MTTSAKLRLITGAIFICVFFQTSIILNHGAGSEYNVIIGQIGVFTLLWCIVSTRIQRGKLVSLIFMFEVGFYILTLGQSMLYAFGIDLDSTLDLYVSEPASDVNTAYLFTILCFLALHFGFLGDFEPKVRFTLGSRNNYIEDNETEVIDYTETMKSVGLLMLPITLFAYAVYWFRIVSTYALSGYADAFESVSGTTSWGKIFTYLGNYFPFVLIMLLVAYRNEKEKRRIVIAAIFGIILLNFIVGNRSEPISYLMVVLWFMYDRSETRTQRRRMTLCIAGFAIVLLMMVSVIGATRNAGSLNFNTIIRSLAGEGAIFESIKETLISMGWSAFPTIKTMQLIPETYDYHYGVSYFFALLSVFPNIFGGTHISVKYAGLPQWLQNTLNMSYGPGYSTPAEAYYNFGWWGIMVMPIIAKVIGRLLDESDKERSAMRLFVMMGSFIILFSFPRREMLTAIRNTTYYVGLMCLAVKIYNDNFSK